MVCLNTTGDKCCTSCSAFIYRISNLQNFQKKMKTRCRRKRERNGGRKNIKYRKKGKRNGGRKNRKINSDSGPQGRKEGACTEKARKQAKKIPAQLALHREYHLKKCTIFYLLFLASSRNLARPISVSGCLSRPSIESNGQVQTSAPASAHFTMCKALRIEAASISVLKLCML